MEHCECRHTMRTEKERKVLMTRLKTVEGQIRGIEKMVESDAYCPDIVMQVSAVTNAWLPIFADASQKTSGKERKTKWMNSAACCRK